MKPKKNHRGDLAGGGITSQHRKTGADNSAPSSGADNPARKTRRANGEEAVFYRCSLALTRGSRLRHTLSPLEARRVDVPRRVGARASRRRTERRGSTAQRAIPPPLLDLGHRPVGWGTRRHLRRHAVVRRESPRCQTSCAPDGHAWGVVAPRGVPARGGCGGGLVGSQEDCALLASWPGPLWRPEAAMRLLWRDWRQALPASGTAWVVRRVLRASCVYGVVAERRSFRKHLVSFGATGAEARSSPRSCWPET